MSVRLLAHLLAPHQFLRELAAKRGRTGNFKRNAEGKLEFADLAKWFDPGRGGFGDLHLDRRDVARVVLAQCSDHSHGLVAQLDDTVFNIIAARAIGARAVGVATGHETGHILWTHAQATHETHRRNSVQTGMSGVA